MLPRGVAGAVGPWLRGTRGRRLHGAMTAANRCLPSLMSPIPNHRPLVSAMPAQRQRRAPPSCGNRAERKLGGARLVLATIAR